MIRQDRKDRVPELEELQVIVQVSICRDLSILMGEEPKEPVGHLLEEAGGTATGIMQDAARTGSDMK